MLNPKGVTSVVAQLRSERASLKKQLSRVDEALSVLEKLNGQVRFDGQSGALRPLPVAAGSPPLNGPGGPGKQPQEKSRSCPPFMVARRISKKLLRVREKMQDAGL